MSTRQNLSRAAAVALAASSIAGCGGPPEPTAPVPPVPATVTAAPSPTQSLPQPTPRYVNSAAELDRVMAGDARRFFANPDPATDCPLLDKWLMPGSEMDFGPETRAALEEADARLDCFVPDGT